MKTALSDKLKKYRRIVILKAVRIEDGKIRLAVLGDGETIWNKLLPLNRKLKILGGMIVKFEGLKRGEKKPAKEEVKLLNEDVVKSENEYFIWTLRAKGKPLTRLIKASKRLKLKIILDLRVIDIKKLPEYIENETPKIILKAIRHMKT